MDLDLDVPFLKRTWTCPFKVDLDLDLDLRIGDLDLDLDLALAGLVTSLLLSSQKPRGFKLNYANIFH